MRALEKTFSPSATAVILKILHPFKCPGHGVMSFEYQHCLPCLLVEMAKMAGDMQRIPLELVKSNRDSVHRARGAYLIE